MSHRARIVKVLADGQPRARTVLEGLARTERDRKAAAALVDYLLALGVIVMRGERRGAVYGLPKGRGR